MLFHNTIKYVIIGFAFYYRINWSFWSGFIHLTFVGLTHCGPGPASGRSPLQLKLNHKVELLCFADKTIIQTDWVYFIKISLTIFYTNSGFVRATFYSNRKQLIEACMPLQIQSKIHSHVIISARIGTFLSFSDVI